jgi:hypothetical protein
MDEDEEGMLSVLLGFVGLGDGRWSGCGCSGALTLRDLVALSLLAQGSSKTGLSIEGRMVEIY